MAFIVDLPIRIAIFHSWYSSCDWDYNPSNWDYWFYYVLLYNPPNLIGSKPILGIN